MTIPTITDDLIAELEAAAKHVRLGDGIHYDNDTGPNDDYFVEWWEPANGVQCYKEQTAGYIRNLLECAPQLIAHIRQLEKDVARYRLLREDVRTEAYVEGLEYSYENLDRALDAMQATQ